MISPLLVPVRPYVQSICLLLSIAICMNSLCLNILFGAANVKKNPEDNAANAFTLHEGTKVEITDKAIKGWREVSVVNDGRKGWLQENLLEEI